jgi:hypothetical protein
MWPTGDLPCSSVRAYLVCAHNQPYQNWLANFLAQDLAAYGLPNFWQKISEGDIK